MNKKLIFKITFLSIFSVLLIFTACQQKFSSGKVTLKLPATPFDYSQGYEYSKKINIIDKIKDSSRFFFNNHTVTLGRVLFYDKALSLNNTVSCGSCHIQSKGFSDGLAHSAGFSAKLTPRNSMAIVNPVDNRFLFWDTRAKDALDLSLRPVFNHLEMGIVDDKMLIEKVSSQEYYTPLFQKAFGGNEITKYKISVALATFINAMYSRNSKFDQNVDNGYSKYTELEKFGLKLFESSRLMCADCHNIANRTFSVPDIPQHYYGGPSTTDPLLSTGTTNIGLEYVYKDNGFKDGQFKIPSLRNIALTGPYMHDGRFKSLEEVLEHYSNGIKAHPNLNAKLKVNGKPIKMNITDHEKLALIAFMKTLTDENLIKDVKFSDPFVIEN